MTDTAAMIGIIGGAVGVLGGSGGLVGAWHVWRREHREAHHEVSTSYERSIATLRSQYEREEDVAKKDDKRRHLEAVENEYLEKDEAYRGEHHAFFISYEASIAMLEKQYDRETDDANKEKKKQLLEAKEKEYLDQQEAYRQNTALRQAAPRGLLTAERPGLSEDVAAELRELLEKAQRLSPAVLSAQDHLVRGNVLFELKRYEEALEEYNAALALRPDDVATLFNRGLTLLQLKRYEQAVAQFDRSLQLQPGDPATLYNRACALSLMGRYDEALTDLREAIARDARYRHIAREDEDFEGLRNDPQWGPKFRELVETEE